MNATAPHGPPPKPAIILATPINVEESRAQRLQRQQARFRDRGGLFVPTNRSTLLDILLGKAPPLKKPRRSASASPSRVDEEKSSTGIETSKPTLRRSPRKQSQKTTVDVPDEQPQSLNDDPESEVSKPIKKATSSKSSRPRPQTKAKVPPKSTTKVRGGPPESLQASTQKIIPNADEDDVPLVKSKPKGKRVREIKLQGGMDGAKGTSKTRGRKVATATISAPVMSSSRLKRSKKAEPIYAELSDDDAASKSTKKTSTNKVKKSAAPLEKAKSKTSSAQKGKGFSNLKQTAPGQLSDISEEDEEYNDGPPSSQNVKVSLLKDKLVVARPASFKSLDASDDDSEDNIPPIKSKSKSKVTSSQGKSQDDAPCKPTKRLAAEKVKASTAPTKTERCGSSSSQKGKEASNVKEIASCQLPDVSEDEEGNLGKEGTPPSENCSNAIVTSSKGKKRANTSVAQESNSQPLRKRIKPLTIQPDVDPSLHQDSDPSGEVPPLMTSKKRRRNPEDAESGVEDGVDKRTKRRKRAGQSESKRAPQIPVEEAGVKPVAKRSSKTKVTKAARKGKKQSSDSATTALKRKENPPMSKPSKEKVKVASKSGLPKSVLQRIKDSLGDQVVDNEPDPIDFLS